MMFETANQALAAALKSLGHSIDPEALRDRARQEGIRYVPGVRSILVIRGGQPQPKTMFEPGDDLFDLDRLVKELTRHGSLRAKAG